MMRITMTSVVAFALVGCVDLREGAEMKVEAPYGRGIEYTDTAREVQAVEYGDAASVTIRCYCQSHRVEVDFKARNLTLDIKGTYSIGGYHGSAKDAGVRP